MKANGIKEKDKDMDIYVFKTKVFTKVHSY